MAAAHPVQTGGNIPQDRPRPDQAGQAERLLWPREARGKQGLGPEQMLQKEIGTR